MKQFGPEYLRLTIAERAIGLELAGIGFMLGLNNRVAIAISLRYYKILGLTFIAELPFIELRIFPNIEFQLTK